MDKQTTGIVIAATKQWWLKVNRKPMRLHTLDGAEFPYIIKIEYTVDGKAYTKRKWINAGDPVPKVGSNVQVMYTSHPKREYCKSIQMTRTKNPFRN
jgi:hypothetical protein